MSLIAAVASAFRGGKFVHEDAESRAQKAGIAVRTVAGTADGDGVDSGAVPLSATEPVGEAKSPGRAVPSLQADGEGPEGEAVPSQP
jgi:hypothetical protein